MKKIFLIAAACGAFMLSSCSKEGVSPTSQEAGKATFVNISLVNREVGATKALTGNTEAGVGDENKISSLEFYVFDATGNTLDPEVGRIDDATPGNGYLKITTTEANLQHKVRVSSGTGKMFVVVANMNLGAPTATTLNTYAKVKAALSTGAFKADKSLLDHNSRVIPTDGFEMSGMATADIVAESANNKVYITISRLVSKVNAPEIAASIPVEIKFQEQIDEVWNGLGVTPSSTITFEFMDYAVINGRSKSDIAFSGNSTGVYGDPVGSPWTDWSTAGKDILRSEFDATGLYTNNYSGQQGSSWMLDGVEANNGHRVYVYENRPDVKNLNGIVGYDPETVTSYIIHGKLKTAGQTDVERYWRVDLIKSDSYHIMRNCVYKVAINKISTPGFGTPQEAEEQEIVPGVDQTLADFVVKIAQWDINTESTEM